MSAHATFNLTSPASPAPPSWLMRLWPLCTISLVLGLWIYALPSVNPDQMGDWGLLTVVPWSLYGALGLLVVSFGMALHRRTTPSWILLIHVLLFILLVHGTPALVYDVPRYSWTWKHVGIIDFILRERRVDPTITVSEIYHYWPGFFVLGAFLTEIAGYKSAISFAGWAPVFFNLIDLLALQLIFWSATNDRRLVWQGIWIFYLSNWIGQDYFSPQALAYFTHLLIVGICLRWLSPAQGPAWLTLAHWRWGGWIIRSYQWLLARGMTTAQAMRQGGDQPIPPTVDFAVAARQSVLAFLILLLGAGVIISSHQLTPFMTLLTLTGLVLLGRCRSYLLPVLFAMLLLIWLLYVTPAFLGAQLPSLFENLGAIQDNVGGRLIDLAQVPLGQRLASLAGRMLTLGVWGLAALGAIRRLRQGYWDLAFFSLILAPVIMLVGNSYGGEIIFRVYLFALPGTSFLTAALLYPTHEQVRTKWATCCSIGLSSLLLVAFVFAYWGKEQNYYFTQQEVDASQFLATTAPPNSLLIEGTRSYPAKYLNYEHFFYVPISQEEYSAQLEILADPVQTMERWMRNRKFAAAYLLITRSMKVDLSVYPGTMPQGGLEIIEQALTQSPKFTVIYRNKDVKIFALTERLAADGIITQTALSGQTSSPSQPAEKP